MRLALTLALVRLDANWARVVGPVTWRRSSHVHVKGTRGQRQGGRQGEGWGGQGGVDMCLPELFWAAWGGIVANSVNSCGPRLSLMLIGVLHTTLFQIVWLGMTFRHSKCEMRRLSAVCLAL